MSWLLATLRSSVGKKFVMGGTGLFLCFFLVMHLAGNLLLFVGPEAYNGYAHKLHENVAFLIVAEIVLFGAMLTHIYLAFTTAAENRAARGADGYAVKQTKIPGRVVNVFGMSPDTTMFLTGALIFAYLIVHLCDFKFEVFADTAQRAADPYTKASMVLSQLSRKVIYALAALVVGIHVSHGFQSAFQSLGLSHPKYTPTIKTISKVFGVVVAVGFGSFVTWDGQRGCQSKCESAVGDPAACSPENAAPAMEQDAASPSAAATPPVEATLPTETPPVAPANPVP